ncbi:MAG: RNA polymerase sigma factor, partial [Solirubrobacterales bacterium]|nr:RNA polymerase sigma factor [Solirubrobacterales bacterium]
MARLRDARLVERARRGDEAAFERLVERHSAAILMFCRHLTGTREDAEDAAQHAFVAAYREICERGRRVELRPWLFAVARNRCVSLLRARRELPAGAADREPATADLVADVERREELRDLLRDLARLPDDQRAALVLSQLDALSHREIALVLSVPPAKVKALVFQARSSLLSTREARETPCVEVRATLATASGSALRRRLLRRHVRDCPGCRAYEASVARQRRDLALVLPTVPVVGLGRAVLGEAAGREGAAAAAGGGSAAAVGAGGGAAGQLGGFAGLAGLVGAPAGAKLATVAAVAVGGVASGAAAGVPSPLPALAGALPGSPAGELRPAGRGEAGGGPGARRGPAGSP